MRKKLFLFICTVLFQCGYVFSQNNSRINVAVNDLKGSGMDPVTVMIVSDRLRAEMLTTDIFRVMERNEMESILKEQGFQQSGACDETSCLVKVGELLGVDRMVAGSVGKVGLSFFTISLRMLNVSTGEILFNVTEDFEGQEKDLIAIAVGRVAEKLAKVAGGEIAIKVLAGKSGDLFVASDHPGASIEIDGKFIAGQTPVTLQKFPAGEHKIIVRKSDLFGSQTVMLNPGALLKVDITMVKEGGSLKIFSTPDGASVTIDGKDAGETPLKLENIAAGEHAIVIDKEGYALFSQSVKIDVGEMKELNIILPDAAMFLVTSNPSGATVLINGKKTGVTPYVNNRIICCGEILLHLELPSYETVEEKVMVLKERVNEREYALKHTNAFIDSVDAFKMKKNKKSRWTRRIIFGVLAAGFGGTGYYFNMQANDGVKTLNGIQADYDAAVTGFDTYKTSYAKKSDEIKKAQATRNILYYAAGALSAGFAVSIPF
jgi:hypothetical protein